MSINLAALDRMKDRFLANLPEFGDFQDRPSLYWALERAYKDELVKLCKETLTPEIFPSDMPPAAAAVVVIGVGRVLSARLPSIAEPQNLLGWRYSEFLKQMDESERLRFARGMGDLLYGPGDSADRAQRFSRAMWPTWQRTDGGNPYALTRSFPTLFLMLSTPDRDIMVRTDLFSWAGAELVGASVNRSAPLNADDYRRALDLATGVRDQLEAWAWRPRDFIDVYSFLWVASREVYGDPEGNFPAMHAYRASREANAAAAHEEVD